MKVRHARKAVARDFPHTLFYPHHACLDEPHRRTDLDSCPQNAEDVIRLPAPTNPEDAYAGPVLDEAEWQARALAHENRVRVWTDPHQTRAARGEKHPVYDFLFTYYGFRAAWLRRWHPGPDILLAGPAAQVFLRDQEYHETDYGVGLRPDALPEKRRPFVLWLRSLLAATAGRPGFYGCFGLHEWAMVYRQTPEEIRHNQYPLRFPPDEIARIVEAQPLRCSHYDAFRFFTAPARPLNRVTLERDQCVEHEQPGCLHANMDLYKWAYKLAPLAPAELIADCFELARDIRELDMRASPYDLAALGFTPVKIETPEGRADYEQQQRAFTARAQPLRLRLLALCDRLLRPD